MVAYARGLVQFPVTNELMNTYYIMRAGESLLEADDILSSNPLFLTNRENALSELGIEQVEETCHYLKSKGLSPTVIKYSLAANCIDSANIVGRELNIGRDRIVPEFTFMDPRGLGKWDSLNKSTTEYAIWAMDTLEGGILGNGGRPPPNEDGTPHETISDQVIRLRQLLSVLETLYSGDTILLIFPDGTGPAVLSCMIAGIPLNRIHELNFNPGQIQINISMKYILEKNGIIVSKEEEPTPTQEYLDIMEIGKKQLYKLRSMDPKDIMRVDDKLYEEEKKKILLKLEEEERRKEEQGKEEEEEEEEEFAAIEKEAQEAKKKRKFAERRRRRRRIEKEEEEQSQQQQQQQQQQDELDIGDVQVISSISQTTIISSIGAVGIASAIASFQRSSSSSGDDNDDDDDDNDHDENEKNNYSDVVVVKSSNNIFLQNITTIQEQEQEQQQQQQDEDKDDNDFSIDNKYNSIDDDDDDDNDNLVRVNGNFSSSYSSSSSLGKSSTTPTILEEQEQEKDEEEEEEDDEEEERKQQQQQQQQDYYTPTIKINDSTRTKKEKIREERAKKAMEEYMNQDDGSEAWLGVMSDLLNENESWPDTVNGGKMVIASSTTSSSSSSSSSSSTDGGAGGGKGGDISSGSNSGGSITTNDEKE